MRRFHGLPEEASVNTESRKAYTQLYTENLAGDHFEAIRDLLPALRCASLQSEVPLG